MPVTIVDANGNTCSAPLLYLSPTQILFYVPSTVGPGSAQVMMINGIQTVQQVYSNNSDAIVPTPISVGSGNTPYLVLFGTGIAIWWHRADFGYDQRHSGDGCLCRPQAPIPVWIRWM
jgi:hypothetical protein